jgi:predicted site-specific integrase-resolvase
MKGFQPTVLAIGDVVELLGVSRVYINRLVQEEKLRCQVTSAGKIFLERDILKFKALRERKAKRDPRIRIKGSFLTQSK